MKESLKKFGEMVAESLKTVQELVLAKAKEPEKPGLTERFTADVAAIQKALDAVVAVAPVIPKPEVCFAVHSGEQPKVAV